MSPPRRHYLTLNGQPPNGGFPPGWIPPASFRPGPPPPPPIQPAAPPPPVQPAAPPSPPPYVNPRPDYSYGVTLFPPVFAPVPAFVAPRPDLGYQLPAFYPPWCMQPAPAAPPPAPAPAPPPTFPRGAYINGATVNFDSNMNYLFPEKHTVIHYFFDEFKPWEHQGVAHTWAAFTVPTMVTVKQLIRQLRRERNDEQLDGISECIELGDGAWLRGSSFKLSDDNSDQTLEALGWTEARGTVMKPVWLALYKT